MTEDVEQLKRERMLTGCGVLEAEGSELPRGRYGSATRRGGGAWRRAVGDVPQPQAELA
jgi:hypothetical protein